MSEPGGGTSESEWSWILEGGVETGGVLLFARGASAEDVIRAYRMDPADAQLLPAARAAEALRLPVMDERDGVIHPWIRAGRAGDWGFAVNHEAMEAPDLQNAARQLSADAEVAEFQWSMTADYFTYLVDATVVTDFEPLRSYERSGTEPDRFVPEMRRSGLRVDRPVPGAPRVPLTRSPRICLLEMLTLALGIRLPADLVLGPLLTVQRGRAGNEASSR